MTLQVKVASRYCKNLPYTGALDEPKSKTATKAAEASASMPGEAS
jgi:hypothetical protein